MEWTHLSYHSRPNEEAKYSRMSIGGTSGMPGSSATLLTGRGSTPMRHGGSHPSPGKGSDLVMLLKSRGMGEGPMGLH
jgi:hypothetical protein